ncbi:MAG: CvpA family protein [Gammaproteobacteria bacterium]|nr:CvpA family protein [Gammaproteobacteria bacterium]
MSWADYVIVAICVASAAFGFWRGFVKEALALATWLVAIFLAWQAAWIVEPVLGEWTAAPELRTWTARALIFVGVLVVGGLLTWMLRALIRSSGLSSTDRSLGAVFGIARGVLLVGLLAFVVALADLETETWWSEARLRPFSEQVAEGIRHYAEIGGRYLADEDAAINQVL